MLLHPFSLVQVTRIEGDGPFTIHCRDLQLVRAAVPAPLLVLVVNYRLDDEDEINTLQMPADVTVPQALKLIEDEQGCELVSLTLDGRRLGSGPLRGYFRGNDDVVVAKRKRT